VHVSKTVDVRAFPGARETEEQISRIAARLPEPLAPLARVAFNYRWAWHPDGDPLFRSLDPHAWDLNARSPLRQLMDLTPHAAEAAAADPAFCAAIERLAAALEADLDRPERPIEGLEGPVAFVCAEYGIHPSLPIYSGGLGVLAGDILKQASDLAIPMVAVGLLYRKGYFQQRLDRTGYQHEYWTHVYPPRLPVVQISREDGSPLRLTFPLGDREVAFDVWRAAIGRVPLYLLDTEVDENDPIDRWITARLYETGSATRLGQYGLLGVGAVRALEALGIEPGVYHFNEGHPALAALELAASAAEAGAGLDDALTSARERCVFTTHTPVPAGNEGYEPAQLFAAFRQTAERAGLDASRFLDLCRARPGTEEWPGLTPLALRLTRHANGVSALHGEVAREMWRPVYNDVPAAEVPIGHVTNGVHLPTFLAPPLRALFDRYLGEDWLDRAADPATWAAVDEIPDAELWEARNAARAELVEFVRTKSINDRLLRGEDNGYVKLAARSFEPDVLTFGFARRIALYKRLYLLGRDPARLERIFDPDAPQIQLVVAGKAHPADEGAKRMLQDVFGLKRAEVLASRIVFLENYDLSVAGPIVAGCDVWLNVPRPPLEASGTSGMKSAANGGLNLSVLDGWWAEGYDGSNGWAIDAGQPGEDDGAQDDRHARVLYDLVEHEVVPLFYERGGDGIPHRWLDRVRASLKTNGPRFSAARMVSDYADTIYPPAKPPATR
jgi:starch phosphorylase